MVPASPITRLNAKLRRVRIAARQAAARSALAWWPLSWVLLAWSWVQVARVHGLTMDLQRLRSRIRDAQDAMVDGHRPDRAQRYRNAQHRKGKTSG